ncbi:YicC/YloC family endoribonuclease [Vermiculatibacterium agrestimuris]|uniref:YicC/YloC family endoribonuclease n=1 Tax=Vermiculatibacterium agrestimuris TaxID=2941519 RepID=UPI00203F4C08|nr:YicC/YloC family endoribonuclease [Vermiculatibacterium agrestimuris]
MIGTGREAVDVVKSMTGYGRGEAVGDGLTITVELRSVNNRYLDCTVKMPRAYIFAENSLKERVQSRVGRGKVDLFVNAAHTAGDDLTVTVNEPLARAYMEALEKLHTLDPGYPFGNMAAQKEYSVTDLARFPDVLTVEKKEEDAEAVKALLLQALDTALDDFDAMREREGMKLAEDILGRAETISALTGKVEQRAPVLAEAYRARLTAKLQEVLGSTQIEESRILTEAAIYADKVAVDEETVRLRSHLSQLHQMLEQGGAVGRKLDFLIQEFNREANTIGSKCNDTELARVVVDIKAEIEKIREQVQNLE